jgi:hypothetical protein
MDSAAQALNARNLRVYQNAYEQGILAGIEVQPGADACERVRTYTATYGLWNLPTLPLPDCSMQDICACGYRAEFREAMRIETR